MANRENAPQGTEEPPKSGGPRGPEGSQGAGKFQEHEKPRRTARPGRKGLGLLDGLLILVFLAGSGVLLYPTVSDQWNRYRNRQLVTVYSQAVEALSEDEYEEIWRTAREYNESHTVNTISDAFQENYILSHPYDTLLNPNGNEIMGSLEIPKIDVMLAIYHGVGAEVLEKGCGHVEGTSLPIGGESAHAVLAAHRGLPSAKLFTDLDQMEPGDLFYIHVMDETFAYEVDQIETVLPEETQYLDIEEGKDYVTLLTCTPYGVNTHRLLVRGIRTDYTERTQAEASEQERRDDTDRVKLLFIGTAVFLLLFLIMFVHLGRRSTGKDE